MNDLAEPLSTAVPPLYRLIERAFVPGVFNDMPAATYHAVEAMSASGARKMLRSPAHYLLMRTEPAEPSDAMNFGTAVHAGVLEPDTFDARVCCAPKVDRRTKDGKATWEAFLATSTGKIALSLDEYERAHRCINAVLAHPAAARLLDGAERELSLFWNDAKYKVPCKARYDARNHGGVIDLKTTQDASPEAFARSIATFSYDVQAAFYLSGGEHLLNETPQFFAFIAVESEPPHSVACYSLGSASILAGTRRADIALERYAKCIETGQWQGYSQTIDIIETPLWARRFAA